MAAVDTDIEAADAPPEQLNNVPQRNPETAASPTAPDAAAPEETQEEPSDV
jgi:hypothetical protein